MIRVAFIINHTDDGWLGGLNYISNLVHAVREHKHLAPVIITGGNCPPAISAKLTKLAQGIGRVKNDPTFGKTMVFEKPFSLDVLPVTGPKTELELVFQGCSEVAGICYPPAKRLFTVAAGAKNSSPKELPPASLKNLFKPQVSQ